ncbi:MAG: HGxxPAAW family protein [Tessaracoccus sp.]
MAATSKYYHHGRSPAAWAGSITAAIGFVIAAIGAIGPMWTILWIGVAIIAIAGIGTMILKAMGYGQP